MTVACGRIAAHAIDTGEVEEVCFGNPMVLRAKSQGLNPVSYCLGQTQGGRHLFCVVIAVPGGKEYFVTARAMTEKE